MSVVAPRLSNGKDFGRAAARALPTQDLTWEKYVLKFRRSVRGGRPAPKAFGVRSLLNAASERFDRVPSVGGGVALKIQIYGMQNPKYRIQQARNAVGGTPIGSAPRDRTKGGRCRAKAGWEAGATGPKRAGHGEKCRIRPVRPA